MKLQRGLQPVARGARMALVGLGALAAGAAKLAIDFDRTSSQMVGLAGVGEGQVERWKDAMLDLAPVVGKAPNELAKALYFISSSGVAASKALDVLEVSAKAATAGLGDTEVVADAVTSAMNAYAKEGLSAAAATDVLVATVREGKGEAAAIAPVLGNILPIASQLGVGFEEVGAAMASMTRLGFDAATAATNLSGVLNALLKPQKQAEEGFKAVGTSSAELQQMLAGRGLLATLQFLEDRFEGNNAAMARAFPNVRALRGVLSLVGKAGDDTADVFKRMEDNTGALGTAFDAAAKTDGFKLQQAFAEIQASGVRMGATVAPAVAGMASALADASRFAAEHKTATQATAIAVGSLSAAIIAANTALKIYNSNLVLATIGQKRLLALSRVAGPIGLVAAAAGGLAYAISRIPTPSEEAADAIRDLNTQLDIFSARSGALNASARSLAHARLDEKASVLALRSAEQSLAAVRKDEHSTALERKQAALAVKQAEQGVADAIQNRIQWEIQNRAEQRKTVDAMHTSGKELIDLADKFRVTGQEVRWAGDGFRLGEKQLGNFRAELRNVQDGATQASPEVRDLAGDILALTQKIGRIPTKTEIKMALTGYTPTVRGIEDIRARANATAGSYALDFYIRTHGSINAPTGVTPGYRQHGGPVQAHRPYIVGERRPELFVPETNGRVLPRVPSATNGSGDPIQVNLNLDGRRLASVLYDPLRHEATVHEKRNG